MRRTSACLLAAVGLLSSLAWPGIGRAYIAVPLEPVPNQAALADCIVRGKITAVREKPIAARLYPQMTSKMEFTVVEVEVGETLFGAKGQKQVLLGFIASQLTSKRHKPAPTVGLEGCFFAVRSPNEEFYVVPVGGFHESKTITYAKDLALARRCAELLHEPIKGLKSQKAGDRLLAAYLVALRSSYKAIRWGAPTKAEPMDAERSKLIMLALAEADWSGADPDSGASPATALTWLRWPAPGQKSTWPDSFPNQPEAMRRWLKEHADSFRLPHLVPAKPAERAAGDEPKPSQSKSAAPTIDRQPPSPNRGKSGGKFVPTEQYAVRTVEGWTVRVNKRLLDEQAELGSQALRLLEVKLYDIRRAVPAKALAKLQKVPIWLGVDDGHAPCAEYHVSEDFLRSHGYNPGKAKAVEIGNARRFIEWSKDQPSMILHELAHAYHDQVLGFDHAAVKAAYQRAVESKQYESVLRIGGRREKAYALTNHHEYFAEATEAFFGTNDFYPFVCAELKEHDPGMFKLLEELWGK